MPVKPPRNLRQPQVSDEAGFRNVSDFGAVGDGTEDDTDALTRAVERVLRDGGGTVFLPAATYRVQGVPWYEGVFFEGAGPGATVLQPVDESDATPMFVAQVTAEVRSRERFDFGGFRNLEIDGLDEDAACVGISTFDLQEVAAADEGLGLYTWLQHLTFEDLYIHDCKTGIELWGDCRYFPITGCRIWNCDVGLYVAHNHPNLHTVEFRFCRVGLATTAMLDAELVQCKFNQCEYGVGGPSGEVDRFGQQKARVDRCTFVGCQCFQPTTLGVRLNTQNSIVGGLYYSEDTGGSLFEINGSGNGISGHAKLYNFGPDAAIVINVGTGDVTQGLSIDGARISVSGGGRAITRTGGTNDLQAVSVTGCKVFVSTVPLDGNGGAVLYIPAGSGGFQHYEVAHNHFYTSIVQTAAMVRVLTTTNPRGFSHTGNQYIATHAVGTSKAFQSADSTLGAITALNRYRNCGVEANAQVLGVTDGTTVNVNNTYV